MFEDVLRFWLDRGVDGFRVDVAHGLFKVEEPARPARRRRPASATARATARAARWSSAPLRDEPMWDQPEVHDVYRAWRRVLEAYDGDRMAVAEAWTQTPESMARYVRPDELHQAFNFAWLLAPWSAAAFADVDPRDARRRRAGRAPRRRGCCPTTTSMRHATRYGGGAVGLARGPRGDAGDAGAAGLGVPLPG